MRSEPDPAALYPLAYAFTPFESVLTIGQEWNVLSSIYWRLYITPTTHGRMVHIYDDLGTPRFRSSYSEYSSEDVPRTYRESWYHPDATRLQVELLLDWLSDQVAIDLRA